MRLVETNDWSSPRELQEIFGNNVDVVGKQTVFDVGGNKVRTITKIEYNLKVILLTHAEYDKNKWKE
jgi:mRNA interferase HigB